MPAGGGSLAVTAESLAKLPAIDTNKAAWIKSFVKKQEDHVVFYKNEGKRHWEAQLNGSPGSNVEIRPEVGGAFASPILKARNTGNNVSPPRKRAKKSDLVSTVPQKSTYKPISASLKENEPQDIYTKSRGTIKKGRQAPNTTAKRKSEENSDTSGEREEST